MLPCGVPAGAALSAGGCRCSGACGGCAGGCSGGCCSLSLCHSTRMNRLFRTASVLEIAFLASSFVTY